MRDYLFRKGLVFVVFVLFFGMNIIFIAGGLQSSGNIKTSKVIEDLELDNSVYVQPDKKLTQEHLVYLEKALPYIKNSEIKQSIQDIIAEIMDDGDATSDEIQRIIESSNVVFSKVYILAEVKTTDKTDGGVECIPGLFLRQEFGFHAKGIFVKYYTSWINMLGWHLHINGKLVSEEGGYIFGYFGYVKNNIGNPFGGPDEWYDYFIFNGFGVLVFHGKPSGSNAQQSSTSYSCQTMVNVGR